MASEHLRFHVLARDAAGEPCDPTSAGWTLSSLQEVLLKVVAPLIVGIDEPEAESSSEESLFDLTLAPGKERDVSTLLLCTRALSVGALHELRNQVLSGDFDSATLRALGTDARISLHADRSKFVEEYEKTALALESLTPHQQEKLHECIGDSAVDIHLRAPAGAGKTFVALHRALHALKSSSSCTVLFVARNAALGHFAASWIAKRIRNASQRRRLLPGLHVLHEPFAQGVLRARVKGNQVHLRAACGGRSDAVGDETSSPYALVVVDEAHHIYATEDARSVVESYVKQGSTHRLLLSDYSQSLGRHIVYPKGLQDVTLSEVVRCSKRIVAGAMAFQLGGEEKLLTKCHHEAVGPPLKSFLFDVPTCRGPEVFRAYAEYTSRAIQHVVSTFAGLDLHNRLAIVVPDCEFRNGLSAMLADALLERFPDRRFSLVDASKASADLGRSIGDDDPADTVEGSCSAESDNGGMEESPELDKSTGSEWLVFDTIHQMDGLERLIVIGIGLDSVIGENANDSAADEGKMISPSTLETRSMLYRAVTRAHLMVVVVNEFLRGGWLEFLGSVRLREDEAFSSASALERSEVQAVEGVVKAELNAMLTEAAELEGLTLDAGVVSALSGDVALQREYGTEIASAIQSVLRSWKYEYTTVTEALQAAAKQLSARELHATEIQDLARPVALALRRGEITNLPAAALDAVRKHQEKLRDTQIVEALKHSLSRLGHQELNPEVATALRSRACIAVEEGRAVQEAVQAAVEEWLAVEQGIRSAMLRELEGCDAGDSTEKLLTSAEIAACHGADIEQAVQSVILKWRKEKHSEVIKAAIRVAMQEAIALPVCRSGCRVRIVGVQSRKDMNGVEGSLKQFNAAKGRWCVQLDGDDKQLALKPENLEALAGSDCQMEELASHEDVGEALQEEVSLAVERGQDIAVAARIVVTRWLALEAQVSSAVEAAALDRQVHLSIEVAKGLVSRIIEAFWQSEQRARRIEDENDERQGEEEEEGGEEQVEGAQSMSLDGAITACLGEWAQGDRFAQQEAARITAALDTAANLERLLLTDAARTTLQQRVELMLRRGEELDAAINAALQEWRRQVVRKQVQQTVWDPSGNETRKITGVVRFMPFKHNGSDHFDYELLMNVFVMLPFQHLGALARVCKRWRGVATDPSWKPELVIYAWGAADVTGIAVECPKPALLELSISKRVIHIACADAATFAITEVGDVWFWGRSWTPNDLSPDCKHPTQLNELHDVVTLSATPAGYFHGRRYYPGYSCAAVTRGGALYTWGLNMCGQLLQRTQAVCRPKLVVVSGEVWRSGAERVLHVSCGLDFLALCVQRAGQQQQATEQQPPQDGAAVAAARPGTSVLTCGLFCRERGARPHELTEWSALQGLQLRQLEAGAFHCCALTTRGDLYTFGDEGGQDGANGNLLGHGPPGDPRGIGAGLPRELASARPPRRIELEGFGPVAEVSCSTYTTVAILMDGRVFSWGDSDGNALGHDGRECHAPHWLRSLRWQRVAHGALAYTNAAVATDEGRVFMWGGNMWEGGIAEGRGSQGPTEVQWAGVPSCYRCSSTALGSEHGFLVFRKQP